MLADLGETNGSKVNSQHYEYGRTYNVKLKIDGVEMHVYIDDIKMSDQLSVPAGERVFLIGYDLFSQSTLDMEINNIRVDGEYK